MASRPNLTIPKRSAETIPPNFSALRLSMKKARNNWRLWNVRTKPFQRKLRTSWTKLVREVEPFTKSTKPRGDWKPRKMNFKPHLKKPNQPLSRKKAKSSVVNWSCPKSSKKSTEGFKRRRRNSKTPGRTTFAPWIPFRVALRRRQRLRLKLFGWRRSLSLTSMSWNRLWSLPTKPT